MAAEYQRVDWYKQLRSTLTGSQVRLSDVLNKFFDIFQNSDILLIVISDFAENKANEIVIRNSRWDLY